MISVIACALPLYGTWRAWICAIELKSSVNRCAVAPVPDEEKVYLPGFAFTSAMNSFALFAGKAGCVTSAKGVAATRLIGDRKSTRLNSSHSQISYAVFCLKKKKQK